MLDILLFLVVASVFCSLVPACITDYKERKVPVKFWRPAAYFGIPVSMLVFILKVLSGEIPLEITHILVMSAVGFVVLAIFMGVFNIFGGADSIATSVIALTSFYIGFDGSSLFLFDFVSNMFVVCLAFFIGVFVYNLAMNNHKEIFENGNYLLLFTATKIRPSSFRSYHGLVLEDITVYPSGKVERSFRKIPKQIEAEYSTSYIALDDNSFALYSMVDKVWVMYILPFIIPITMAYAITLLCGNLMGFLPIST